MTKKIELHELDLGDTVKLIVKVYPDKDQRYALMVGDMEIMCAPAMDQTKNLIDRINEIRQNRKNGMGF